MTSRESSISAGEILEYPHKANSASHRSREPGINSLSRGFGLDGTSRSYGLNDKSYRRDSRSPEPYRRRPDRSPSPYRRNRDRSPEPFRHGRDSRSSNQKVAQPHKRKASPHRQVRPEKRHAVDSNVANNRNETDNSRSSGKSSEAYRSRTNGTDMHRRNRIQYEGNERPTVVPSFGGINDRSSVAQNIDPPSAQRFDSLRISQPVIDPTKPQTTTASAQVLEDNTAPVEEVPTVESREEKKRRWAAKRALLQQTLTSNASEMSTPNGGSPAVNDGADSTPGGSPRPPDMDSVPASPDVMVVDKEAELSDRGSPAVNSPSAANYDPTQDMLEDRIRAEQHAQQNMPASAYNETNPDLLSTLPAEKIDPVKKQKKNDMDMFAFSDDEDEGEDQVDVDVDQPALAPTKGTILDAKLLDNWDDPDGYYKIISNELVSSERYRMVKSLGRGVFANVAQAEDVQEPGQLVAIKIVRRNDAMRKASLKEMDFLRRLNDSDPQDKRHIVRLLGSFDHKGHLCIVFEHLSKNLRDLLKEETSGHGLSLQAVKTYARQMFSGLKHLQDCQIIHADLKPDNILVSMDKKIIKIADLGTAADKRDNNEPTPYLVSRFYRAPEIILGMEIGYAVDMWAIGCTVYELWTGKILFPGRSNNQMVKVIMECMGWPSEKLLKKGLLSGQHFEAGPPLKFASREVDQFGNPVMRLVEQQRMSSRPLKNRVQEAGRGITGNGPSATELNDFVDLLGACLNWNFEKRIQPKEAINHKFFVKPNLAPRAAVAKPAVTKRGFGPRK